jgi:hypothetical protein
MKKFSSFASVIILLILVSLNISCDLFGPSDPVAKTKTDAWATIINAHAAKQHFYNEYFRINSNNYKRGKLFVYEPNEAEINYLWEMFYSVLNLADDVDAAVDTLVYMATEDGMPLAKTNVSSSVFGALADFFGMGKGVFVKNRKRILLIASNMSKFDRDQLYNELVIVKWKKEIGTADEFWAKLQNGDLDDKASTLYKLFYDYSNSLLNPFTYYAHQSKLTPGMTMAKDGMELCNKGINVVIETAGVVVPGLSKAKDLYDDSKDLLEKSKKMVDKPLDAIYDEVKSRAIGKVSGMVDVDNYFDPDGAAKYVKILAEVSVGTDDPDELIEKGIDYGIAKLTSSDKSIKPDYAIAKNQQPTGGIPAFLIAVGNMGKNANEFIMNLPGGNWDITAKDRNGQSSSTKSTVITSQQETAVDVVLSDSTNTDNPNTAKLSEVLDSLGINLNELYKLYITLWDGGSPWYPQSLSNNGYIDYYALHWSGHNFTSRLDKEIVYRENLYYFKTLTVDLDWNISGNIALDEETLMPVLNLQISYSSSSSYIDSGQVYTGSVSLVSINLSNLPYSYVSGDRIGFSSRSLSLIKRTENINFSYDTYQYERKSTELISDHSQEAWADASKGSIEVSFSAPPGSVIYNY